MIFGRIQKKFDAVVNVTEIGWSAEPGNHSLACETAVPNASAKAVLCEVLTFQSLSFFEFVLIVGKFLYCRHWILSILYLTVNNIFTQSHCGCPAP